MKKYIVKVHEKGEHDDIITYEFETLEEGRDFLKAMHGVFIVNEFYSLSK